VEQGKLTPLDGWFDFNNYYAPLTYNSQNWGVPLSMGGQLVLLYNKSMVPTPPQTVEELIALGDQLRETYGSDPYTFAPLANWATASYWLLPWMQAINPNGVPVVGLSADTTQTDLNNDALVKTLHLFYDFYDLGLTRIDCDYTCLYDDFHNGRVAMSINGDWSIFGSYGAQSYLGDNLGIAPLPAFEGQRPASFYNGTYLLLTSAVTPDELTVLAAFLRWYTTDLEQIKRYSVDQGQLPAYKPAFDDPTLFDDPLWEDVKAVFKTSRQMPTSPAMDCLYTGLDYHLYDFMSGYSTPEDIAALAQSDAENCLLSQ
jgi:maltose-binding protein MalE